MERWEGRVAVITGTSSGIGVAIATELVRHGMIVVGCARKMEPMQVLEESLKDEKGKFHAKKCDVAQEDQIMKMFEEVKQEFGGVDVMINNAGCALNAPLASGDTKLWRQMLEVNVLAPTICSREAIKSMTERETKDGHIFLINSMSGHRVVPSKETTFYSATKHTITALTEGLRVELHAMKSRIKVSAISPGLVNTNFFHVLHPDNPAKANKITARHPGNKAYQLYEATMEKLAELKRQALEAPDVAEAILYALGTPPHVQVHDILLRPIEQAR